MAQDSNPTTIETVNGTVGAIKSPFCREIRSKKFYFLQEMPTREEHILDSTRTCWCQQTMQAVGPDGEMVHPQDCTSGRSCYKSLFEP